MNKIILASNSPRRKELLNLLNVPFTVEVSHVDEDYNKTLLPHEIVEYLSSLKAKKIALANPQSIVIGADTIVSLKNKILEKPKSFSHAFEMLKLLSNETHQVITGITIIHNNQIESFNSLTEVTFYELSDQEITDYINSNEPFDKAGAYGIQGYAAKFVKRINGDYFTVVGLPIAQLYQMLKKYL